MRRPARHSLPAALLAASLLLAARAAFAEEPGAPVAVAIADLRDGVVDAPPLALAEDQPAAPVEAPELADIRQVAQEMSHRMGALRGCYERELRHHPQLAGSIELRFTVARNGTVRRASVGRDQLHSRALGRCLVSHLDGARFPAPAAGPLQLAWPLRFRTGL